MGYAFISYSSKDSTAADTIKDVLNSSGVSTWMAPYDIPPGSKYAQVISRSIKECACVVLLLTYNSQASVWVSKEIERAIHYSKPIIPIQMENIVLNDEFEFYISTDQIVTVSNPWVDSPEMQRVICELASIAGADKPVAVEEPTEQHIPEPSRNNYIFSDTTLIGRGFAGAAYHTHDMHTGQEVTLKEYNPIAALDIPLFSNASLSSALKSISHPNLGRIIDVISGSEPSIIMEYIPGTDLWHCLSAGGMNMRNVLIAFRDMLCGIAELHKSGIYYGDLTPNNIIVSDDRFVLCDFSESNYFNQPKSEKTVIVSKYLPPITTGPMAFTDAGADIYQAGILLDELTYSLIKNDMSGNPVFSYFYLPGYTMRMEPVGKIIQKAINLEPSQRYTDINRMISDITKLIDAYY